LRFHPECPFNGAAHPCLIALFRDVATDAPAGIHRIALTAEAQKIDRMMLGRWPTPRAVKLWPAKRSLVVGEGIETVLAAATRIKLRPAWALCSAGGVERLPIIDGVERLVILVDRDENGKGETSLAHHLVSGRTPCDQLRRGSWGRVRLTGDENGVDIEEG
jgi:hypothetical protein